MRILLFSSLTLMIEGSGSRRPKNMWIRWIRIRCRNTAAKFCFNLSQYRYKNCSFCFALSQFWYKSCSFCNNLSNLCTGCSLRFDLQTFVLKAVCFALIFQNFGISRFVGFDIKIEAKIEALFRLSFNIVDITSRYSMVLGLNKNPYWFLSC